MLALLPNTLENLPQTERMNCLDKNLDSEEFRGRGKKNIQKFSKVFFCFFNNALILNVDKCLP